MSYAHKLPALEQETAVASAEEKVRSIEKTRVQFDLPPRSMKILAELKDKTDAASYAEVFKNALKLYDGIITEVESGKTFFVRNASGEITEFKMFL